MTKKLFIGILIIILLASVVFAHPSKDIRLHSRTIEGTEEMSTKLMTSSLSTDSSEYWIIQLDNVPTKKEKEELKNKGIHLLEYIPNYAWFAKIDDLEEAKEEGTLYEIKAKDKMLGDLFSKYKELNKTKIRGKLFEVDKQLLQKYDENCTLNGKNFVLRTSKIRELAKEDEVQYISDSFPELSTYNAEVRESSDVNDIQIPSEYNLSGEGVTIAEWDGGLADKNHNDLKGRVIIGDTGSSENNHSTHVAGTVLGNGSVDPNNMGMAPDSQLISYDWWNDYTEFYNEYDDAISQNSKISQNSWGYSPDPITKDNCENVLGDYHDYNQLVDNKTRNEEIAIVWAAGNQRSYAYSENKCGGWCYCGGLGFDYNTTTPMGTAKNVITVGAVDESDVMSSFSSWGPTDDGRIKPDVVANGVDVESTTLPEDSYGTMSGTSMAAPAVSGILALLQEYYKELNGETMTPELAKALLIQSAKDLGNQGPDYKFGWGLVNASKSAEYIKNDESDSLFLSGNLSSENKYLFEVPDNKSKLKITLVWMDYPGTVQTEGSLVNDLDLNVISPQGNQKYPWTLDPYNPTNKAVRNKSDQLNPIEQVYVENPEGGIWQVNISSNVVKSPQNFALITNINDKVAPRINITSPVDGSVVNTTLEFSYTINETNVDSCWYTNVTGNNETLPDCDNLNLSLDKKDYNLTLYVNDSFGHLSSDSVEFSVDSMPPEVNFSSPTPANNTNTKELNQTYNVSVSDNLEEVSQCYLEINNTKNVSMNMGSSYCHLTYNYVGKGNINYKVWAKDNNDNWNVTKVRNINFLNSLPEVNLSREGNIILNKGQGLSVNVSSLDINNDTLTYDWYLNSTKISSQQNLSYQFNNTQLGIYNLSLNVSDGENITVKSINVNVNAIPSFSDTLPDITVISSSYKLINLSKHFSDEDDPLNYSYNCTKDSVNISINGSIMNITSYPDNYTSTECKVTAYDGINRTTSNDFTISVNALPYFTNLKDIKGVVDHEFVYDLNAEDDNDENLNFSINTSAFKIDNTTGVIKNTTTLDKTNKTYQAEVNVTDGKNTTRGEFNITIVDMKISNLFLSENQFTENKNLTLGCKISSNLTLKDASLRLWYDNGSLRNMTNVSGNKSDYEFSTNITDLPYGSYEWGCGACDTYERCYSADNYSLTINSFPSFNGSLPNITLISSSNQVLNLSKHFSDEDDPLNYSYNCTKDSVNISINESIMNITPYPDNYTSTECNVTAYDGINRTTSNDFIITINFIPRFKNLMNIREMPYQDFVYNIKVSDENDENLNFSINNGDFIINENGTIRNKTNFNESGAIYQIEVNVSDGINTTTGKFNISTSILPKMEDFSKNLSTNDINESDVENFTGFKLGREGKGLINFAEEVNLSYLDLDRYVNISQNRVEVNTSYVLGINKSANITLYNVSIDDPVIYKDDNKCGYCNDNIYDETGENVTFGVKGFSSYYAEEKDDGGGSSGGGGGGGGASSSCGDETCDEDEDCESCPQDCGECECNPSWVCNTWSACEDGTKTRECFDANTCGTLENKPITEKDCTVEKEEQVSEKNETGEEIQNVNNDSKKNQDNETKKIVNKTDTNENFQWEELYKNPLYSGLILIVIAVLVFFTTIVYIVKR